MLTTRDDPFIVTVASLMVSDTIKPIPIRALSERGIGGLVMTNIG
jgi:hypothetical protein